MQYIGNCPHCGGELKSISIGWVCEKRGGFVDMKGEIHKPVNELFMPNDVLKEQDEITGGKYWRAIERMGRFGLLFLDEDAAKKEEDTAIMPRATDLAGNEWFPVRRGVIALSFAKCKELRERAEKAEEKLKEAVELLRGTCSACKHYSAYHRKGKCAHCWRDPANPACLREYQEDCWEWKYD